MIQNQSRLTRRMLTGLLGGLLGSVALLAGCSTHTNAPGTEVALDETGYTVERDLRFSPTVGPRRFTPICTCQNNRHRDRWY